MKRWFSLFAALTIAALTASAQNIQKGDYGYLYCHMSDKGQWTAFAVSRDGYHYEDILGGEPIMNPKEHARIEGGQRDAYICRSWNGKGYVMVTTDMNNAMTNSVYFFHGGDDTVFSAGQLVNNS